jgi:catechol 2,3-dioxygenase-like lactoylglutathione lyase family enzyme
MIRSRGLNHINLTVKNLKRSVIFYQKAFGLKVKFTAGRGLVFMGSPGARDVVTLCKAQKNDDIGNGGVSHFGFEMNGPIEKCIAQVERAGGKLLDRGEHAPGIPYAYVEDPDGYVIELGT